MSRAKRKRSSTGAASEEEEEEEEEEEVMGPWQSSPPRHDIGKKRKTLKPKETDACVICGQAGLDSGRNTVTELTEETKKSVRGYCVQWEGVTPGDGLLANQAQGTQIEGCH